MVAADRVPNCDALAPAAAAIGAPAALLEGLAYAGLSGPLVLSTTHNVIVAGAWLEFTGWVGIFIAICNVAWGLIPREDSPYVQWRSFLISRGRRTVPRQ